RPAAVTSIVGLTASNLGRDHPSARERRGRTPAVCNRVCASVAVRRRQRRALTPQTSIWSPPASLSPLADEVHVWRLSLDRPTERFLELLQLDEVARANRFYIEKDRKHFVVARGFLRLLLAWYLHTEAKQLQFVYGAWGKPS